MAVVTLQDIHVAFGPEIVLDHLDLQFHPGEKVGMVGANGCGKTTILKLITGQVTPDMGRVIRQRGLRIGYLPQEATFSGERTVLEEMHAGVDEIFRLQEALHDVSHEMEHLTGAELQAKMRQYDRLTHEFEIAGGYEYETRIQMTLAALGFEPELHHVKTSALSGGQLSRLGLAQVLMLQTDLLLLDEPTNHLDLQATEWLERFLANYRGAAVVISHDRYLLDRVACKIIEVDRGQAKVWPGNYSNFIATKETVRLQEEREYTRRVEMIERTRDFIARNKDQEGMRGTAKGRKTRLNRLLKENPDFLTRPTSQRTIAFSFGKTGKASEIIIRCENLSKSYGDLTLFEDLSFDILNGERLGITGPNGTGKTTLIELALGHIEPTAGKIRMGESLRVGYLDQHGEVLDPNRSVLDEAWSANPELVPEEVRRRSGRVPALGRRRVQALRRAQRRPAEPADALQARDLGPGRADHGRAHEPPGHLQPGDARRGDGRIHRHDHRRQSRPLLPRPGRGQAARGRHGRVRPAAARPDRIHRRRTRLLGLRRHDPPADRGQGPEGSRGRRGKKSPIKNQKSKIWRPPRPTEPPTSSNASTSSRWTRSRP